MSAKKTEAATAASEETTAEDLEAETPENLDEDAADADAPPDVPDEAEAQARLERLGAALAALDDDALRSAVDALSEASRTELAGQLQLPRPTMHLGAALPPLLRRKLRAAPPPRQLTAAFTLVEAANDETVRALGERSDDPSRDDMLEVLPSIIDQYGTALITVLLASYAASDAQCQAVMAELLVSDERFTIGEPIADAGDVPHLHTAKAAPVDDAARAALREERRAAKSARRDAAQHEREAQATAHAARRAAQRRAKKH
ncbi:MAG: hypothetical protein JWL83_3774 [Actinomycetia bacterium]|nr:hypothetical protein [Actinomycetes bacterium]